MNIDIKFRQNLDSIRIDRFRIDSGAEHLNLRMASGLEEAFCHLGPGAVVGAKE